MPFRLTGLSDPGRHESKELRASRSAENPFSAVMIETQEEIPAEGGNEKGFSFQHFFSFQHLLLELADQLADGFQAAVFEIAGEAVTDVKWCARVDEQGCPDRHGCGTCKQELDRIAPV